MTGQEQEVDVSWALKILEREQDYEQNLVAKYFHSTYLGALFGAAPVAANLAFKRPAWAGIQAHIGFAAVGIALGIYINEREKKILATRDARLRDYIIRHPEDFPPPVRVKYADAFAPWVPIR